MTDAKAPAAPSSDAAPSAVASAVRARDMGREAAGLAVLILTLAGAATFFRDGVTALLEAWRLPEYSHGPLIPVLSGLLFLRQLKDVPVNAGPVSDRWPGVALLAVALVLGAVGKVSNIDDLVAYALILWVGAVLLISFGWSVGRQFWPGVLHLVYMLPLPGVLYYKISTVLQAVSSELGVWMLRLIDVPVFLDGNIIDLGVLKLHVAEACSGLRYLFPIMSFSYVFACLYRGPTWHKAVLLLAAVPITVVMNSVRVAFGGWIANRFGVEWLEGFTHFFEGWVIFLICVVLLFLMAWGCSSCSRAACRCPRRSTSTCRGWPPQMGRIRLVRASPAMITAAAAVAAGRRGLPRQPPARAHRPRPRTLRPLPAPAGRLAGLRADPAGERHRGGARRGRLPFGRPGLGGRGALRSASSWPITRTRRRAASTRPRSACPARAGRSPGWSGVDISAELNAREREATGIDGAFDLNRAVIQKGETRMMAYYWFAQHGRHTAWDFAAKMWLVWDGITLGRTDGALVRIITPIARGETDAQAEIRLREVFVETVRVLPRFVPEAPGLTSGP